MKKIILTIFCLINFLFAITLVSYASPNEVEVNISNFKISINGEIIDNEHSQFPFLQYKGVTYLPLSSENCSALGLKLNWDSNEGLNITKAEKVEKLITNLNLENSLDTKYTARLANFKIKVNGKEINNSLEEYPVLYFRNVTYFPLTKEYAQNDLNLDFKWNEEEGLVIGEKVTFEQSDAEFKIHAFYANESFKQFNKFLSNGSLNKMDSISFGWSKLEYDESTDGLILNMDRQNGNDFYIPKGYVEAIVPIKQKNISTQLNIFAGKDYEKIFARSEEVIEKIVAAVNGKVVQNYHLSFDGVVIDFEAIPVQKRNDFTSFLERLNSELKKYNKKLYVAIQPREAYDYKNIARISDQVIVMLHDYDPKKINIESYSEEFVKSPLTPIKRLEADLNKIVADVDSKDLHKLWLQISFATTQWQTQNSKLLKDTAYHPSYDLIYQRIIKELDKGRSLDDIIKYDVNFHNPYLAFTEDEKYNTLWYEDTRSVLEKLNLAKDKGLGGISLWRMGTIPDFPGGVYLDVWKNIIK